jgi:hypothetical protein
LLVYAAKERWTRIGGLSDAPPQEIGAPWIPEAEHQATRPPLGHAVTQEHSALDSPLRPLVRLFPRLSGIIRPSVADALY